MGKSGLNVLVVEDEENIRMLLQGILEPAGFNMRFAEDGVDGLRQFFDQAPDLVLLDVQMPKMDGWTLLERIRERGLALRLPTERGLESLADAVQSDLSRSADAPHRRHGQTFTSMRPPLIVAAPAFAERRGE